MLPRDVDHYLGEIVRVLKPGGRCLISYFLMNAEVWQLIRAGVSAFNFSHRLPGCYVEYPDVPERVIGYDEGEIRALYAKHSLAIVEPVLWGVWCGRQHWVCGQDMIVAVKGEAAR
jgi:hypothetical protein